MPPSGPQPTFDAAICVPLRRERRNVAGLIRAVAAQDADLLSRTVLVLLFDGCDDGGDVVARELLATNPTLATRILTIADSAVPDAGRARGAAIEAGRPLVTADGMLLTTDADTRPARDWLAANRRAIDRGADVVCGRIRRRKVARDRWRLPVEAYLDRLCAVRSAIDPIAHDPRPRHWNEGGASIALTVAAYDRIGGVPPVVTGEDRAMVANARRLGLRVRHDPAVRVATSARAVGRAAGGLADAIRAGRTGDAVATVEHPAHVVARFRREASVRSAFVAGRALPSLGLDAATVRQAASAEVLFDLMPVVAAGPAIPLSVATTLLAALDPAGAAAA